MRDTAGHPQGEFLGFVRVQVASRFVDLPVRAARLDQPDGSTLRAGFLPDGPDGSAILVDANASDAEQRSAIERASADAARHLARKMLN